MPQVVDAVRVPVIAAGGIADGRGIAAALALGAAAVQIGTAYLFCPEAKHRRPHREALQAAHRRDTALTNVFTGRPARGIVNRAMREVGPSRRSHRRSRWPGARWPRSGADRAGRVGRLLRCGPASRRLSAAPCRPAS